MGHVARIFEEAGIPTVAVVVRAFRPTAEAMRLPRAAVTRHPLGRPLGAPHDVERQRQVLCAALQLLDEAVEGGTLSELDGPYRTAPQS